MANTSPSGCGGQPDRQGSSHRFPRIGSPSEPPATPQSLNTLESDMSHPGFPANAVAPSMALRPHPTSIHHGYISRSTPFVEGSYGYR